MTNGTPRRANVERHNQEQQRSPQILERYAGLRHSPTKQTHAQLACGERAKYSLVVRNGAAFVSVPVAQARTPAAHGCIEVPAAAIEKLPVETITGDASSSQAGRARYQHEQLRDQWRSTRPSPATAPRSPPAVKNVMCIKDAKAYPGAQTCQHRVFEGDMR